MTSTDDRRHRQPDRAGLPDLVRRARDGDRAALERLLAVVQNDVHRLALRMTGCPDDALDATQEILIRVMTRLSTFRGEAHATIAFTAGAIMGRRSSAIAVASAVAVGVYMLHAVAASAELIRPARAVSPWWWLVDRNLLVQPPTLLALGLPVFLSAALAVVAVIAFDRRDLRLP